MFRNRICAVAEGFSEEEGFSKTEAKQIEAGDVREGNYYKIPVLETGKGERL